MLVLELWFLCTELNALYQCTNVLRFSKYRHTDRQSTIVLYAFHLGPKFFLKQLNIPSLTKTYFEANSFKTIFVLSHVHFLFEQSRVITELTISLDFFYVKDCVSDSLIMVK